MAARLATPASTLCLEPVPELGGTAFQNYTTPDLKGPWKSSTSVFPNMGTGCYIGASEQRGHLAGVSAVYSRCLKYCSILRKYGCVELECKSYEDV